MKLGEAILTLKSKKTQLSDLQELISKGPKYLLTDILSTYNKILHECQELTCKIQETKLVQFKNQQHTLLQVEEALSVVKEKIKVITLVLKEQKDSLDNAEKEKVFSQLCELQATEQVLYPELEQAWWDTELLEDV